MGKSDFHMIPYNSYNEVFPSANQQQMTTRSTDPTFLHLSIIRLFFGLLFPALMLASTAQAKKADIVYHPVMDPKTNMVMLHIPLPRSWKLMQKTNPEDPNIVGPNGIRVLEFQSQNFIYTNDPYMQQSYLANGVQMRPPPGGEQVMQQDIGNLARSDGAQLIKQYRLPKLAAKNRAYMDLLFKVAPTQNQFESIASEWKNQDGTLSLIILNYSQQIGEGMATWFYGGNVLEAPAKHFEQAKKDLISALLNVRYNPRQIQAYNQNERMKANISNSAHQNRMRSNQRAFENSQRAINQSNQATNDAIMDTWRNHNAASDRMQQQTINSISDQQTVYNSANNQSHQVESGSDQYWITNDGKYIPSDDLFYNPNMDPSLNYQEWNEAEVIR